MPDPVTPSRNRLAALFPNHEDLRAFERLFEMAGTITPAQLQDLLVSIGVADIHAIEALDLARRLAVALEFLAYAPTAPDVAALDFLPAYPVGEVLPHDYHPGQSPVRVVESELKVKGDLTLPKAEGAGIKVDTVSPSFGWKDLLGAINPRSTGPARPALAAFRGGNVRQFAFSAGDNVDMDFHLPHDYATGTDLLIHAHWGHNGTSISGSLVVDFFITYAQGYGQQIFPAEKNITLTVATPNIATIPRWSHRIDEIALSVPGGSGTELDTADIEVDGLILIHVDATTIPTIGGGAPNEPFIFLIDIHYQSTNIGTKNANPDFYV